MDRPCPEANPCNGGDAHKDPEEGDEGFLNCINPNSLEILTGFVEPHLSAVDVGSRFQFERLGYFCVDKESTPEKRVFNLTVNLKNTWAKLEKKGK